MENYQTQLLFVYGTLLLADNKYGEFLLQHAEMVCIAKFPGELFDLGTYPGAIYNSKKKEFVEGRIFKMDNIDEVLATLDYYEGIGEIDCEYERRIIEVDTDEGLRLCYCYIFNQPTNGKRKILGGNYLNYLNRKC